MHLASIRNAIRNAIRNGYVVTLLHKFPCDPADLVVKQAKESLYNRLEFLHISVCK
jgi:hypothetical protein